MMGFFVQLLWKLKMTFFFLEQIYPYSCQTSQDISLKAILREKGLIDVITGVR